MNNIQQQLQKLNIIPEEREMLRNEYGMPYDSNEKGFNQALSSINYDLLEQFFRDRFYEEIGKFYKKYEGEIEIKNYNSALDDISIYLKNYKNNK